MWGLALGQGHVWVLTCSLDTDQSLTGTHAKEVPGAPLGSLLGDRHGAACIPRQEVRRGPSQEVTDSHLSPEPATTVNISGHQLSSLTQMLKAHRGQHPSTAASEGCLLLGHDSPGDFVVLYNLNQVERSKGGTTVAAQQLKQPPEILASHRDTGSSPSGE